MIYFIWKINYLKFDKNLSKWELTEINNYIKILTL